MATTESRPGFRLPWTADRADDDPTPPEPTAGETPETTNGSEPDGAPDSLEPDGAADSPDPNGATGTTEPTRGQDTTPDTPATDSARAGRPSSSFLADLTRAMRAAAEEARERALAQLRDDAKAFVDLLREQAGSAEVTLRTTADDDIAAIREWSKAEIARIREETERRIAERKATLETEIAAHGARVERQIEGVEARIAAYEADLDRFFEVLRTEEDPARFATLASRLPEPPAFDEASLLEPTPASSDVAAGESASTGGEALAAEDLAAAEAEALAAVEEASGDASDGDAEAAAAWAPGSTDEGSGPEAAVAARLEALLEAGAGSSERASTQVVVVGLMSVASIAGFKRAVSRIPGVQAVAVSSGPNGEFVYAVDHTPGLDLAGAITGLPGFEARITGAGEGVLAVTARDPEA